MKLLATVEFNHNNFFILAYLYMDLQLDVFAVVVIITHFSFLYF